MVESITTALAAGGVATYIAKKTFDGIGRLCGPAADAVADALGRYAEQRLRNLGRVVEIAESRLQMDASGSIPMRVAIRTLQEAADSDDSVVLEYFGGVLASSRTPLVRDDRGAVLTSLVTRLSTYHLRTHYIYYSEIRRVLLGKQFKLTDYRDVAEFATVFVPNDSYLEAMEFDESENASSILTNTIYSLMREDLIKVAGSYSASTIAAMSERKIDTAGTIMRPTVAGIELYLWALGRGQSDIDSFLDPNFDLPTIEGIAVPPLSSQATRSILVERDFVVGAPRFSHLSPPPTKSH